jgi:hypothetical protein
MYHELKPFWVGYDLKTFTHLTSYMKSIIALFFVCTILIACGSENGTEKSVSSELPLTGTWKLLSGTLIEKGDTAVTDYTKNISFIKIINATHFAFLSHDLNKGKDSAAVFSAGGGSYTLKDNQYNEHLEYCTAREWEGNDFEFTITIINDTLVQSGIEKVESAGVDRINIEKYIRLKN